AGQISQSCGRESHHARSARRREPGNEVGYVGPHSGIARLVRGKGERPDAVTGMEIRLALKYFALAVFPAVLTDRHGLVAVIIDEAIDDAAVLEVVLQVMSLRVCVVLHGRRIGE